MGTCYLLQSIKRKPCLQLLFVYHLYFSAFYQWSLHLTTMALCVLIQVISLFILHHTSKVFGVAVLWHRGKRSFFHPIIARSILDKKPPLFPQRIHNSRCLIFSSDQEVQRIIQPWTLQLFSMEEPYRTKSIMERWSVWFISFLIIVAMYLFPRCISTLCCLDLASSMQNCFQQETVLHYCQAYLKVAVSPPFLTLQKAVPHYVNQIFWRKKTGALSQRVLARKTQQKHILNFTLKQKIATQHKIKQRDLNMAWEKYCFFMKVAALFLGLIHAKQQPDFLCFKGGVWGWNK